MSFQSILSSIPQVALIAITGLLIVPSPASAAAVKDACANLEKCANAIAELTGTKYVFDGKELAGMKIAATANFELTKENAEEVFTLMLEQNEYTRLPLGEEKAYTIIRSRNARDSALPIYTGDSTNLPKLPQHWDLSTARYRAQTPELVDHLARNMRSFLPANSRVIPDENSGTLLITAPNPIIRNVLNHIQALDVKLSPEKIKELKRAREERKKAAPAALRKLRNRFAPILHG
jgi:type II secretory pathway component GspD/PulD (secretin)